MNASPQSQPPLEVWGGVECSRVRLAGRVEDQLVRTGHAERFGDVDRFAELGLRAIRYPVLWERHHGGSEIDWSWADERLGRLRELGVRPIVGFVHHGGGPLPGGLLDPGFVEGLAAFAAAFARRFPWVEAYTPINEPLTTARFSGLYGMWHPFGRDASIFARIFFNECLAVRAAMRAIREINPRALLVQTEDLGKTHSTPLLAYQADFENERRWLTFDLLCGDVRRGRPMFAHLTAAGLTKEELNAFADEPCPPDVLGANYYVTSERFLDERMDRYPADCHGGNEQHAYADVPAVRVREEGLTGLERLLAEAWARYGRPMAVTEVQIACTREEQLRWLHEAWRGAQRLRARGVDVRAITAWGLLGAYDWSSLLMEERGHYEGGAFDCRSTPPRATAVARALRELASTGDFSHPALPGAGWWNRRERFEFPPVSSPRTGSGMALARAETSAAAARPLLILGATGTLGSAFVRVCRHRGLHAIALTRCELDLTDAVAVRVLLERHRPWAVVNAAGISDIDAAEKNPALCLVVNAVGSARVAEACAEHGCAFLMVSSEQVFDGRSARPYVESDRPAPVNHYGRSQHEGERRVARVHPEALIVRTSALFGPWDDGNFATRTLRRLRAGEVAVASAERTVSPTYVPDVVNAALDLLIDGEAGIWHAANAGAVNELEWARVLADRIGCAPERVVEASPAELGWIAARPRYAALGSERAPLLPTWEDAMNRFLIDRDVSEGNGGGGETVTGGNVNEEIFAANGTTG